MGVELLLALRVMLERAHPAAIGHAHHQRNLEAPLGALAEARHVVLDLVEALEGEAGELDLADRAQPVQRHPHRGAHDGGLGQRAVDHAPRSELPLEVVGDAEHAAIHSHVLAQDEDVGIPLHFLLERHVERLHHIELGHGRPDSRLVVRWPRMGTEGGGAAPSAPGADAGAAAAARSRAATSARWASTWSGGAP